MKHIICCPQCDQITELDETSLSIWCNFCDEAIFFKENQRIKVLCNCGTSMQIPFHLQGKNVRCRGCQEAVAIPIVPLKRDHIMTTAKSHKEQPKIRLGIYSKVVLLVPKEQVKVVQEISESEGMERYIFDEEIPDFSDDYQQVPLLSSRADLELSPNALRTFSPKEIDKKWWLPIEENSCEIYTAINSPENIMLLDRFKETLPSAEHRALIGLPENTTEAMQLFWKKHDKATPPPTIPEDVSITHLVEALPAKEEIDNLEVIDSNVANNTIVKLINQIILTAYREGASDLHIEIAGSKPHLETQVRFRVDGICQVYRRFPIVAHNSLLSRIKVMADLDISNHRTPQYGKIQFNQFSNENIRIRVTTMPTAKGYEEAILRILPSNEAVPLEQISMLPDTLERYKKNIAVKHGLILVAGPTGAGKTTTMHSSLRFLKKDSVKIITIEDPVEIAQEGMSQIQVNNKAGLTFASALRGFLRSDPDIIMVGEIRDNETAAMATQASLTGHLVLSTLHTNSAAETSVRMLHLGVDPHSFADALKVILAQRLMRKLCSKCREEEEDQDLLIEQLEKEYVSQTDLQLQMQYDSGAKIYRPVGCDMCFSGYKGRVGNHELFVNSKELRALICQRKSSDEICRVAMQQGMKTLRQDAIIKVLSGFVDVKQIKAIT